MVGLHLPDVYAGQTLIQASNNYRLGAERLGCSSASLEPGTGKFFSRTAELGNDRDAPWPQDRLRRGGRRSRGLSRPRAAAELEKAVRHGGIQPISTDAGRSRAVTEALKVSGLG
jgi:hypothetical protein